MKKSQKSKIHLLKPRLKLLLGYSYFFVQSLNILINYILIKKVCKSYFLPLFKINFSIYRSSPPEMFLGKCVLKICSKFAGEQPCQREILIKVAASEFKEIWETFHIALRNLTPLIRKEINLFIISLLNHLLKERRHIWSSDCLMRNYYTNIYWLELKVWVLYVQKITCTKLLIIARELL